MSAPVTVLGLGNMGTALAKAFLGAGHPTTVWNRTPGKAAELVAGGAVEATDLDAALTADGLIVVCLLDYEPMADLLGRTPAGATVVTLTTGSAQAARDAAELAGRRGVHYLDGAIMAVPAQIGGPQTLIFYGGPEASYQEHQQTLAAIAGGGVYLGPDTGLPAVYDIALIGFMWITVLGLQHGLALAATEKVRGEELLPYASAWLEQVITPLVPELAAQADSGEYPDGGSALDMQLHGMHLWAQVSRSQGVDPVLPDYLVRLTEQMIEQGHGPGGFGSLIEALRQR
ncbi:NAD(P)-dependent oxidoreductase [Pseudonocardiaceae bacterium YIM PH 21723]|nr:NAD(P)-dependent oxidoreductase [Pseudonocardiaceae bacterium YIM PH 21723]